MKSGDRVKVTDRTHFRFGQVGTVEAAPDQLVLFVVFTTLGRTFYCGEWIDKTKLTHDNDDTRPL